MNKRVTGKRYEHLRKLCAASLSVTLAVGTLLAGTGCAATTTNQTTTNTTAASQQTSTSGAKDINLADLDLEYTDRDKNPSYDASSATKITLSGTSASVSGTSSGVTIDGSTVTITAEGVYILSGTLTDGQIVVDCNSEDKAKVQVVLDGANITNSDGPAIYVKQAKKVFLTLADGTTNTVSDGANYVLEDGSDEPYACIYSKDDLTLQGSGTLNVTANYRHAICSKDDLVITGGTYNITATEDALRGRDCVKICDGTFNLTSGQDAVKSNNDSDGTVGYVSIDGGTFNITAGDDAFHAETALLVNNGTINVAQCYEGLEGQQIYVNGGTTKIVASDDGVNAATGSNSDAQFADAGTNHKFEMTESAGGAAQSNAGSTGSTASGNATRSAQATTSQTSMVAQGSAGGMAPGGQGASGGTAPNDAGSTAPNGGGAAMGGFTTTSAEDAAKIFLKVTGGYLEVDAQGDGLDSNGSIEVTGGTIVVNGPNSQGDGALDYETTATISGGTLIAIGSSGMAEGFTDSTQAHGMTSISGSTGTTVEVRDASGTLISSIVATKSFDNVVVSAPSMTSGSTYTVTAGSTSTTFTASTDAISNSFNTPGFGGQGMGSMQRR